MTKREAAVISVYTGYTLLEGDDLKYLYEYASELLGREAQTIDFFQNADYLRGLAYTDLYEICKNLEGDDGKETVNKNLSEMPEPGKGIRREDDAGGMAPEASTVSGLLLHLDDLRSPSRTG